MAEEKDKEQEKQEHKGPGQPTLFREKYINQAYKLALLGATDKELADFFEVCEDTINEWKKVVPEFSVSIKKGKIQADSEVAEKLFHRAKGYEHPEDKIFLHEGKAVIIHTTKRYPPDTGAAMAWLKNRRKASWRDSHDFTTDGEKIEPKVVSFLDVTKTQEESKQDKPESNDDTE